VSAAPDLARDLQAAAARAPRLSALEREALALRSQHAIDVIRFPDLHELPPVTLAGRESLLAAVVWPSADLLEWSTQRAAEKLARRWPSGAG
jgi:hypothetical protein